MTKEGEMMFLEHDRTAVTQAVANELSVTSFHQNSQIECITFGRKFTDLQFGIPKEESNAKRPAKRETEKRALESAAHNFSDMRHASLKQCAREQSVLTNTIDHSAQQNGALSSKGRWLQW